MPLRLLVRPGRTLVGATVLNGTEAAHIRSDRSVARDSTREVCLGADRLPFEEGGQLSEKSRLLQALRQSLLTRKGG